MDITIIKHIHISSKEVIGLAENVPPAKWLRNDSQYLSHGVESSKGKEFCHGCVEGWCPRNIVRKSVSYDW